MTVDDFGNWDTGPLEPGERLFIDPGSHREMAMVDYSLTEDRYMLSYREAGEVLTTRVMQGEMADLLSSRSSSPTGTGSSCSLRSIIARPALAQRRGQAHAHPQARVWPIAREAIQTALPDDPADLDTIASIVDELVAIDPESMSFRYSRDRKGQINLPTGVERINIGHVASVMQKVGLLLEGAADGMADMLANAEDYGP